MKKSRTTVKLIKKERSDRYIIVDTKHNKILHSKGFVKNILGGDTIRCDIVENDYIIPDNITLDY